MRHLVIILLVMAFVSCNSEWKPGDSINNGHDFLANAGISEDSLVLNGNEFNFDNDGEKLPHRILDLATCQALGLDKMMGVDTNYSIVRVWGVQNYPDKGITLLLGQTSYNDTRTCWLATYGKEGMLDFMRLGECGGMNLSYWDDIDEHTRLVGIDSMRMVMPDKFGKPINVSRWVSYNEQHDGADTGTDSTLWFIDNEIPITIGNNGHFTVGKIGTVYSADTTVITPYWRYKRQLELMGWAPLSDTTFCDKVEALLNETRGHITDPTQLQGDFSILAFNRMFCDTERFMQWCCDHPESQLTRGLVKIMSEINPEYLLDVLSKIKNTALQQRSRELFGI